MKNLTKEQMDMVEKQGKEILRKSEGNNIRELLAEIYVDYLDDKTIRQGRIMADSILSSIQSFDSDFGEAKENLNGYVDKFMYRICKDKSCADRCNLLAKLSAAASGATRIWAADSLEQESEAEKQMKEIEGIQFSEENATPELEAELMRQAKEALLGSGIMLSALIKQEKQLKEMENADEAAQLFLETGVQELDFRAVAAMLTYVNAKNGTFDNLPDEITAAQAATLVCAQYEEIHILTEVAGGGIPVDVAAALLQILGIVVIARLSIEVIFISSSIAMAVFPLVLAIPACLMVIMAMLRVMERVCTVWEEDSKKIVNTVRTGISLLIRGAESVIAYIKDTVLPAILHTAFSIMEKVRNLLSPTRQTKEQTVEEQVEQEVFA